MLTVTQQNSFKRLQALQQNNEIYITVFNGSMSLSQVDHTELDNATIVISLTHPIALSMFENYPFEDGGHYKYSSDGTLYTFK